MDTELLRTFLEVRTTRHFGRAAQNLCITQAAVSARIKQLEESLGAVLFVRHRNNIQLSQEGERLVPHAETVLLALARARQEVSLEDPASSQLHIGVRSGVWSAALQQKLLLLHDAEPELILSVQSREPEELLRQVVDRTLDIAICYEPPSLPELESRAIGELRLRLYSSRKRETLERALAGNYVYLDWGGGFARFHSRHFGELAAPRLQTNLKELASDYLALHGGACYLPASLRQHLAQLGLVPVRAAPEFSRQLHMVYHSSAPQLDLIEAITGQFAGVKV